MSTLRAASQFLPGTVCICVLALGFGTVCGKGRGSLVITALSLVDSGDN